MSLFSPPSQIEHFQSYNYRPIETIPPQKLTDVKAKLEALQSAEPLVSLVFIAWNEEDYIFSTLASLAELTSDYSLELIVVNNNSTDNTQNILDNCGVKSIFETRQGYPFARQAGFEAARGKYIISGDTDTLYPATWVNALIKPMEEDDEVVCTYSIPAFYRDNQQYDLGLYMYEQARLANIFLKNFKRPHLNCRGFSMAFRKEVAGRFGGYNTNLHRGSDGYLAIELSDHGRLKLVKEKEGKVYTNMRRAQMDGSLWTAFVKRFTATMRYFFHLFTTQKNR